MMERKVVKADEFNHEEEDILDAIGADKRLVNECIGKIARNEEKVSQTVEYAIEMANSINTIIGVCYELSRVTAQTKRLLQMAGQMQEQAKEVKEDEPGMLYG